MRPCALTTLTKRATNSAAGRILGPAPLPLFAAAQEDEQANDPPARLPAMTLGAEVVEDYTAVREGLVTHVIADRIEDLSPLLDSLGERDAPVPIATARADEVTRPNGRDPRDPASTRRPQPHLLYPSRDFH